MNSSIIVLVHYNAFSSNQVFQFPTEIMLNKADVFATPIDLLEIIFRECNVVDGSEWICGESQKRIKAKGKGLRSMSVGDSVTIINGSNWEVWSCEGCGWKMIGSNYKMTVN